MTAKHCRGILGEAKIEKFFSDVLDFAAFVNLFIIILDCTAELQILAERESIYRLLHQTTPESTMKKYAAYTIGMDNKFIFIHVFI